MPSLKKKNDLIIVDCLRNFDPLVSITRKKPDSTAILALIDNLESRERVFSLDVWDYIAYPVVSPEWLIRVRSCLSRHNTRNHREGSRSIAQNYISAADSVEKKTQNAEQKLVQKACQHLLVDLSLNCSQKDLAHKIGTNRNTLAQASKNILGMGIHQWLVEKRMKEAERLCRKTGLPIENIGYRVGYKNPNYFSDAFKKYFNLPPGKYRKKYTR